MCMWSSQKAMANIVPESWRDRVVRAREQDASGQSVGEFLPAHDAGAISSTAKMQHRLGKLVHRVRYERNVASTNQLLETTPQRGTGDSQGEKDTERLGQCPATESIGTRGYRLLKGGAYRLDLNHPRLRKGDSWGLRNYS